MVASRRRIHELLLHRIVLSRPLTAPFSGLGVFDRMLAADVLNEQVFPIEVVGFTVGFAIAALTLVTTPVTKANV